MILITIEWVDHGKVREKHLLHAVQKIPSEEVVLDRLMTDLNRNPDFEHVR